MPIELQQAIEAHMASQSGKPDLCGLMAAREDLTLRYRQRDFSQECMISATHRNAYVVTRMPATYAVVQRVMSEIRHRLPDMPLAHLLDLGAGPGTVMWAALEVFESIESIAHLEQDLGLIDMGKKFAAFSNKPPCTSSEWHHGDMRQGDVRKAVLSKKTYDCISLSYALGELPPADAQTVVRDAWCAAKHMLVIIEPGTPYGFETIRMARSMLIKAGANIIAPCPHAAACPMATSDWCHFAQRLERTGLHRRVKDAALGHEDEKYSYIAVAKTPAPLPYARILRHPQRHSGHVGLTLCTADGVVQQTISRKSGELYKHARKAEWGEAL
jgi:ribosomal protein RSM22 (predicted rRNA methylase)